MWLPPERLKRFGCHVFRRTYRSGESLLPAGSQTEVSYFEETVAGHKDIARLDVQMRNMLFVNRFKAIKDLFPCVDNYRRICRIRINPLSQSRTTNELHY